MRRTGVIAAAVWAGLAAAAPAQDASARLDPANLLQAPIAAPAERPPPRPTDDLPSRPARMRFAADPDVRPVDARTLDKLHRDEADSAKPPARSNELFDYLASRRRGRSADPDDDEASSRREPQYDRPGKGGGGGDWFSGERLRNVLGRDKGDALFCSDHAFDQFVSPISNPFLFEDPRSLTEVRPLFLYQQVPAGQPNFQGGDIWFGGLQARVALTKRLSVTVNKIGAVGVNTGDRSPFGDHTGLSELWLGPKYTFYRDPDAGAVAAAGVQFHVPLGGSGVFQDTGRLSIVPYGSVGKNFLKTQLGSLNALGSAGYSISTNSQRSDYFTASGHLSWDVANKQKFFPLVELNWVAVTTDGKARQIAGEGRDLFNAGGMAKGSSLLTGAVGLRYRITPSIEIGGAYESPLTGNRDFFRRRFLVDLTWRY